MRTRKALLDRRSLPLLVLAAITQVASPAWSGAAKAAEPSTVEVKRGLLRIVFRIPGAVDAGAEVTVQARSAGRIDTLEVKVGQSVKKDQDLLTIDPKPAQRVVDRARVDLLEALAREQKARVLLEQEKHHYEQDPKSETRPSTYSIELLRQELALCEAITSRTQIAVEEAREILDGTRLRSPIDGVVTEILVGRNQIISEADCDRGTPLIRIADLSRIAVNTEIDQGQVRDVQLNLAASVALPAFPDRIFPGRIVSISPKGYPRDDKVLFPVRIDLEGDPGDAARPGLSAICEIVAIEKPNVLLLNNQAIRMTGLTASVVVLDQGLPRPQEIKIGRSDGVVTEILEGLNEGQKVLIP